MESLRARDIAESCCGSYPKRKRSRNVYTGNWKVRPLNSWKDAAHHTSGQQGKERVPQSSRWMIVSLVRDDGMCVMTVRHSEKFSLHQHPALISHPWGVVTCLRYQNKGEMGPFVHNQTGSWVLPSFLLLLSIYIQFPFFSYHQFTPQRYWFLHPFLSCRTTQR